MPSGSHSNGNKSGDLYMKVRRLCSQGIIVSISRSYLRRPFPLANRRTGALTCYPAAGDCARSRH
jgi:hypothetical protein